MNFLLSIESTVPKQFVLHQNRSAHTQVNSKLKILLAPTVFPRTLPSEVVWPHRYTIMAPKNGVVYGPPDVVDFMEGTRSMGEFCQKRFNANGDLVVLIDGVTGETVTSRQLRDRSARVAECLRAIGIGSGSTVGLSSENRIEFAYVMFGAFMAGASVTGLNPMYTEGELKHTLNLSKPRIIFASQSSIKSIVIATKTLGNCQVVLFEGKDLLPVGVLTYNQFLKGISATTQQICCEPQDIDQHVGLILYSSGTTGAFKGVQLTQANTIRAMQRHLARKDPDEEAVNNQAALNIVPFFHTFGIHVLFISVMSGDKMVTLPSFDPNTFLGAIQKYKPFRTTVAPPIMVFLAKSPLVDQYDISSLRLIFNGAAPLTKELAQAVYERLNSPIIRNGYGMTEGTMAFTCQNNRFCKSGSVGQIDPGVEGRVVDPDSGRVLGPNEEGELQFKGATMKGYAFNEKATRETVTDDGWLRTGDIGYYDSDGEFFIVDRLKELIKFKGYQVAPAELEGLLLQNTKIADAGVIGVPDERAGELPFAFVVKQPNVNLTEAEVVEYVARNASDSKRLRGGVRFVESIPKNPSGKILRRELRLLVKSVKSKL